MTFPICLSTDIKLRYKKNLPAIQNVAEYSITHSELGIHLDIWECSRCRLAFIFDKATAGELVKSYQRDRDETIYLQEKDGRIKSAHKIIGKIKKIKPREHLLDIGCGTGIFISEAQKYGYEAWGIEPAPVNEQTQGASPKIINNYLEKAHAELPNNYFDIITMFDVIEHLTDPHLNLKIINTKLKAGGLLVLSTPNWSSWLARLAKEKWYAIQPHHLYYFSKKNLVPLLNSHGFRILYITSYQRYFSLSYILIRLIAFNKIFKFLNKLSQAPWLKKIIIPINLHDELFIMAVK